MYSKYIVMFDKKKKLPNRKSLIETAWGDALPTSHFQDAEDLNEASFFDVKVNKWEANKKWSSKQNEEPTIRIEMLRDDALINFSIENDFQLDMNKNEMFLIVFELDGEGLEIDYILLANLVKVFAMSNRCYFYDTSYKLFDGGNYFELLPPKEILQDKIFTCSV